MSGNSAMEPVTVRCLCRIYEPFFAVRAHHFSQMAWRYVRADLSQHRHSGFGRASGYPTLHVLLG